MDYYPGIFTLKSIYDLPSSIHVINDDLTEVVHGLSHITPWIRFKDELVIEKGHFILRGLQ